jgi:hypothetical protein
MAPSPRAPPASDVGTRWPPGASNTPEATKSPSLSSSEHRRRPPPPLELNHDRSPRSRDTQPTLDPPVSRAQGDLAPSNTHPSYSSWPSPSRDIVSELSSSPEETRAHGNAGLGLVLPYDSSHSPSSNTYRDARLDSGSFLSSPMADRTSSSPSADRTRLIGLGELATPRWTTKGNVLHEYSAGDDWESDVVGGYGGTAPVSVLLTPGYRLFAQHPPFNLPSQTKTTVR